MSSEMPSLAVVIVTHRRTPEAVRTMKGLANLKYEGPIGVYVGDNNSDYEHVHAVLDAKPEGIDHIGVHSENISPNPYHCGSSWNISLLAAHQWANYVLWLEDDWELQEPLDVTDYINLLQYNTTVGCIRLGTLAVGSAVEIVGDGRIHYLKYLNSTQYAYSGNPQIRHRRFMEHYGMFHVGKNPGDIELDYDHRIRNMKGPEIWRPVDARISPWGAFAHIGQGKSYE